MSLCLAKYTSKVTGTTHLHIHQVVDTDTTQLGKLLATLLEEPGNVITFLALENRGEGCAKNMIAYMSVWSDGVF